MIVASAVLTGAFALAQVPGGGGGIKPKPKGPGPGYTGPGDTNPPPIAPAPGSTAQPGAPLVSGQAPPPGAGDPTAGLPLVSGGSALGVAPAAAATPATWFEWNQEPLLRIRERARDTRLRTAGALDDAPVDPKQLVSTRVVPALLDAYASSQEPTLSRAALFGLARLGEECDAPSRARVRATLEAALSSANADVALAATVALGVFGGDDQAVVLARWFTGGAPGAGATPGAPADVAPRQRAGAALALALVGQRSAREDVRRFVVHKLAQGLQRVDFGNREVDAACALGLGIVPLRESGRPSADGPSHAAASREEQIEVLSIALRSRDSDRALRAHAAVSLARMFEGRAGLAAEREAVLEELVSSVGRSKRAESEVVQGMLLALGHIADSGTSEADVAARKALAEATDLADPVSRGFALVALAEAAARKGSGKEPLAGLVPAEEVLLRELVRGRSGAQGWAALGLGLLARERTASGLPQSKDVLAGLARAAHESQSSDDLAAIDLARGLSRDPEAVPDLARDAFQGRDPVVRAAAALAIGFAGAVQEIDALKLQLADVGTAARVTENSAIALVLLDEPEVAARLIELVRKTGSLERQAALLEGVGRSGDEHAIDALLALLAETDRGPQSRAFVVRALSRAADRDEMPWFQGLLHGSQLQVETEFLGSEQGLLAMTRW
ncbi:MAG: hypothetical protein EPO68_09270 [Planctomycetota bacterium]|nr:MAG: hypothetical protein EPO68_09270 [Planctomycetota bacterium]